MGGGPLFKVLYEFVNRVIFYILKYMPFVFEGKIILLLPSTPSYFLCMSFVTVNVTFYKKCGCNFDKCL